MPMVQWSEALFVGVAAIDKQHEALVAMINNLYDKMRGGLSEADINQLVAQLKDYAIEHFDTEEGYMQRFEYPEFAVHKAKHKDFCIKVMQVENDCQQGKVSISMDILNFLSNWLITHINETDKKLGAFIQKAGAQG